ncbi:SCP2 sterol-binding domain-containing protein [Streptomyces sp. NPDC017890]|uniref:SCP2 sterol-binding domain-containing protein n=1 Tax=Streptomyces sp. NPDC017890 TaxID=3365015 RepID=UPI0037AE12C8
MEKNPDVSSHARGAVQESLEAVAHRLATTRSIRPGNIVLHLSGQGGGTYVLECGTSQVRLRDNVSAGVGTPALVEVIGDAEVVQAIIDGQVDARKQFLAGGLRLRGDLRYFSDIALELGVLSHPL